MFNFLGLETCLSLSYKFKRNFIEGNKAKMLKSEVTHILNILIKHGHKGEFNNFYSNTDDGQTI